MKSFLASPAPGDGGWRLDAGDCRLALAAMPADSVHCCATSPPYWGRRDYGLPPLVWGGDSGCEHRFGANDRCVACAAWRGQLGQEPELSDYCDHLVEVMRAVRRVLRPDGLLWVVLGDCYADRDHPADGLKRKDLVGAPWQAAFRLRDDGWLLRSASVWHKPNAMPEPVKDRPTMAHEYIFMLSQSEKYYYDQEASSEPALTDHWPGIGPKHSEARGRGERYRNMTARQRRNRRSVWSVSSKGTSEAHAAPFPEELVRPMILGSTGAAGVCAACGTPLARPERAAETEWRRQCACPPEIAALSGHGFGSVFRHGRYGRGCPVPGTELCWSGTERRI